MWAALIPLIAKAAAGAAGSTAVGAGLSALMPKTGMTTPGAVPQMAPQDDVMLQLQQLMNQKSKLGGKL